MSSVGSRGSPGLDRSGSESRSDKSMGRKDQNQSIDDSCNQKPWQDLIDSDDDSGEALPTFHNHLPLPLHEDANESDSDSSDCLPSIHEDYGFGGDPAPSSSKKKSGEKPVKKHLTQKQRDELVKETLSKTQKLIREQSVSLPYEKPKTMGLKEFLAKRAQAKAEFYNPELRKLRPPTPPPLDLSKLEQPVSSEKVEGWVKNICETDQLPPEENDESLVDDAFTKLDGCLMEELSIADDKQESQVENQSAEDGCDGGSISNAMEEDEEQKEEREEHVSENVSAIFISEDIPLVLEPHTKPVPGDGDPINMDLELEAISSIALNDEPIPAVLDERPIPIPNPEGTNDTETEEVLQTEAVGDVTGAEDDFKMKEAALEEYLEANNPKPRRITIADRLKADPEFAKIAHLKPSLHPPGKGYIDLFSAKPRNRNKVQEGVETLKSRFLKHAAIKKKPTEQHFIVTVTTKEEDSQGNQKSIVDNVDYVQHFNEDEDNTVSPLRQTPGHKFSEFQEKLQAKIRSKRVKEYEEKKKLYSMYEDEKILNEKEPLEEAEDILEEDDFTTESEPEETDEEAEANINTRRKKKKKLKSAFVDDEAEVSDSDPDQNLEEEDEGEGIESEVDGQESGGEDEDLDTDEDDEVINSSKAPKSFRRVKPIIDSSDEEEIEVVTLDDGPSSQPQLQQLPSSNELILPIDNSGEENGIEVVTLDYDDEPSESQFQLHTETSEDLIVPKAEPDSDPFGEHAQRFPSQMSDLFPVEISQTVESPLITPAQRVIAKLIEEPILNSQSIPSPTMSTSDEFVSSKPWDFQLAKKRSRIPFSANLGRFDSEAALDSFRQEMPVTPSQPLPSEIAKLVGAGDDDGESMSPNLASLCSGVFPSQNPLTPEESPCPGFDSPTPKSLLSSAMISAHGNEQVTPRVEREKLNKTRLLFVEETEASGKMTNGVDENEQVGRIIKRKKRRLQFSDDEDDDDAKQLEQDENEDGNLDSDVEHEYDSEENEIVERLPKKPITKGLVSKFGKIRREFVENEAELSGSEEGSGDEDERGLDQMDEEEGDEEEIDEESLRDQIGQQHIRNLLDDDARQVRRLQDVLLEDGDLHGEGILREKQFKWKHIDTLDFNNGAVGEEDPVGQAEDEAERLWKEQKAEKARWMKENSQLTQEEEANSEEEDSQKLFLENSKYFKLGKSTLKKIKSSYSFMELSASNGGGGNSCSENMMAETSVEVTTSRQVGIYNQSLALLASPDDPILKIKRGSFLARGSSSLSKIAEMTKGAESTNSIKVNSRNFVFSVITPPGPEDGTGKGKRKNFARHPSNRQDIQPRKMPRMDRSFDSLDAATKAASIFSQY